MRDSEPTPRRVRTLAHSRCAVAVVVLGNATTAKERAMTKPAGNATLNAIGAAVALLVAAPGCAQERTSGATPPGPGAPVETGKPNVPEFKPAFPGQTRAPAVQTQTALEVTEIASGFQKPWAIAFLPDRR